MISIYRRKAISKINTKRVLSHYATNTFLRTVNDMDNVYKVKSSKDPKCYRKDEEQRNYIVPSWGTLAAGSWPSPRTETPMRFGWIPRFRQVIGRCLLLSPRRLWKPLRGEMSFHL